VPGTTRDPLCVSIEINGVPIELIDTAGLREQQGASEHDAIEVEGMRRAREVIARADHVLYLVDAAADPEARSFEREKSTLPNGVPMTRVMNKSDIARASGDAYSISAATGSGIDTLRAHLATLAGHTETTGGAFSARARHVEALERAAIQLDTACQQLASKQGELAAFELRGAQASLGEVIGDVTSDELLGHIFSSFCIGK
jgi:tRNA modification GTPase